VFCQMRLFPGVAVSTSDSPKFDPVEINITFGCRRGKKDPLGISQMLGAITFLQQAVNGAYNFPRIALHARTILGQESSVDEDRIV
jgi:hypothetical protein